MKKDNRKVKFPTKSGQNEKSNFIWIIIITIMSFLLSGSISYISDVLMTDAGLFIAVLILIFIIAFGIFFDIIGVAVTAAEEVPFHSMAAKKVRGAKTAISLIRNANRVSNFCNDVIGDICGVVSGGTGAVIILKIMNMGVTAQKVIVSLTVSAMIASLTVAGKAVGKNFALNNSNGIVYRTAWLLECIQFFKKN